MNILLMMSASIACAKATGLISTWVKKGHNVKVICTESTFQFIGKATIEGLSGNSVISSTFTQGEMMEHIHLSRWADKIVLAPATANTINKITAGIADDMLTTTWIAALGLNKPMYIAPAMNTMMWNYPATQDSITKLQSWSVNILQPQAGELACGETGVGRMMEVDEIDNIVTTEIQNNKHILITAGGTREYVDGVRYIGNLSTGKTGAQMADHFTSHGYHVTWLGAINAIQPKLKCEKVFYETFNDLAESLKNQLNNNHFDSIIHAAAVSDFSVTNIKIDSQDIIPSRGIKLSTSDTMDITLKKNPKLINKLKEWSKNSQITVIGFKLTNTDGTEKQKAAVMKLLNQDAVDFVAHNNLSDIKQDQHFFTLYQSKQDSAYCKNIVDLCRCIERLTTKNNTVKQNIYPANTKTVYS